jgi:hypothetical protein
MFWGLSQLPPDQQETFLKNWNEMRKKGIEDIKKKEERKMREKREEERILKFVRENPPNPTSFKHMFVYGKIYEKYGDKIFAKKSEEIKYKKPVETEDKAVNTEISNYEIDPDKIKEPTEQEETKSWFGF